MVSEQAGEPPESGKAVGSDPSDAVLAGVRKRMSRAVYDMEVSLFHGALQSFRKTTVLHPFPKAFIVDGVHQYQQLETVARGLPTPGEVYGDGGRPSLDPDTSGLLQFFVEHCNLKELPVESLLPLLGNPLEGDSIVPQLAFEVISNDTQRAKEFDAAALEYGVKVGFHGSPMGNWYCIAKGGLRNYSGTQKQLTGSLFGEGIYLSKTARLAADFSVSGDCWASSENGTNLRIVAQCDWLPTPETTSASSEQRTQGGQVPDAYIIVPNASHVRVRKLLVYTSPVLPPQEASRWRPSSFHMILFYIFLLALVVLCQAENRSLFRYAWRQMRTGTRAITRHLF